MGVIQVGYKAAAFTLPDSTGKPVSLKDFASRAVVLYFYPKADTTACTKEACEFAEQLPAFKKLKVAVLGVSPDEPKVLAKFAGKYDLGFGLLSDVPAVDGVPAVIDKYGAWGEKSMYGRKYMGVIRTTYLIDRTGKVAARWDKVKVAGHVEEVMGAVAELG